MVELNLVGKFKQDGGVWRSIKYKREMKAIEKLENFISVNRLTANTRIPSERDLCEMWGVSRSTLRNAVDTLVEYGLLYRVLGSGVYVAEPKLVRNLVALHL